MQAHLQGDSPNGLHQLTFASGLEGSFTSFIGIEPTQEQLWQASRFASSAIWDIIKKATHGMEEQDRGIDEEILPGLLAMLMKIISHHTFEHSERVMEWTVALAAQMGIDDGEELESLAHGAFFRDVGIMGMEMGEVDEETDGEIAAYLRKNMGHIRECGSLHDIGKVRIPREIIDKAGSLTSEEYDIIKAHPLIGVEIVRPYPALHRAIPGIRHHHEHYDGSGYPDGLRGAQIPLAARLISVTDSFDAMTQDRPYRKAMGTGEAVSELKRLAGRQFDPHVVRSFLKMLALRGEIDGKDALWERPESGIDGSGA
jgi:putative nucleotidyltransferase with HDIG domain